MQTTRVLALGAILASGLLVGVSGSAVATEEEVDSQPNGDF